MYKSVLIYTVLPQNSKYLLLNNMHCFCYYIVSYRTYHIIPVK